MSAIVKQSPPQKPDKALKQKPRPGRGQDEFTRYRRLSEGRCPTHGIALIQSGIWENNRGEYAGDVITCTRGDCAFVFHVEEDSNLWDRLKKAGLI